MPRARAGRRLTIARKAIQQIAETAIEHQLTDRDWQYWLAEALALVLTIADDLPLDGLQVIVARPALRGCSEFGITGS